MDQMAARLVVVTTKQKIGNGEVGIEELAGKGTTVRAVKKGAN